MKLKINPQYLELVPRPDKDQLKSLKNSMSEDGQQVKIIVNPQGIILDGHTRFNICNELGLNPKYTVKKFPTLQKEKEFVVSANINRRQLTLFERGEILFSWWKEERKKSNSEGGHSKWKLAKSGIISDTTTNGKKERLLSKFARILGTSATITHEITWLLLYAPENVKEKLRKEEISIDKIYVELAKPLRKPRGFYKYPNRLLYEKCLVCKEPTASIKKTNCHVHSQLCCTKCGWGN